MSTNPENIFEFGSFRADAAQRLLLTGGEPVKLSPKAFELLMLLIQNPNQVIEKERIMSEVWKDSFVEEANLSVHISSLRKIFAAVGDDSAKIETFPKVGYRFIADVRKVSAKPIDPNEKEADAVEPVSIGRTDGPKNPDRRSRSSVSGIFTFSALLTVLAGIALGFYFFSRYPAADKRQQITSIAVLPFVNESGDPDFEYITDGITEGLIRDLARIPTLSVKARNTVFKYKDRNVDPIVVGSEISVEAVVMGRIRKAEGDQIALNYEMVDARSGSVLMSEQALHKQTELISLQNVISKSITRILLQESPGPYLPIYAAKREAYELYLRGRYHLNRRTNPDFKTAIGYFQRAIENDPDFALAYSGLSDSYSLLVAYGGAKQPDGLPPAKAAAAKAIQLSDSLAEAHASMGNVADSELQTALAEREYKRAIELNPSYAQAYQWYAEQLTLSGRHDQALVAIRRALGLDPLSRIIRNIEGRILFFAGRSDEAINVLKRNIDLDPTWGGDHDMLFHVYEAKGMYAESAEAYITAMELFRLAPAAEIQLTRESFLRGGWKGFVRHRLSYLEEEATREYVRPMVLAEFYARVGDKDKAFGALNEALGNQTDGVLWIRYLHCYDDMRQDPRFDDLLLRIDMRSQS
jgi:DNA-binding winged helix-turn-helix (wHTH) protein/TolB-like protein